MPACGRVMVGGGREGTGRFELAERLWAGRASAAPHRPLTHLAEGATVAAAGVVAAAALLRLDLCDAGRAGEGAAGRAAPGALRAGLHLAAVAEDPARGGGGGGGDWSAAELGACRARPAAESSFSTSARRRRDAVGGRPPWGLRRASCTAGPPHRAATAQGRPQEEAGEVVGARRLTPLGIARATSHPAPRPLAQVSWQRSCNVRKCAARQCERVQTPPGSSWSLGGSPALPGSPPMVCTSPEFTFTCRLSRQV